MTCRPRTTPPGWPPPERIDVIGEALRRDFERYVAEFEAREERTANERS